VSSADVSSAAASADVSSADVSSADVSSAAASADVSSAGVSSASWGPPSRRLSDAAGGSSGSCGLVSTGGYEVLHRAHR
jgi:hypothetical protein